MVEEVINSLENSLENMKLTTEEEEVIAISDEGRKEEIESCSLSLIGKFLTCKTFNKKAAQNTLRRAWGLSDGLQIVEVGSNMFQFKFKSEFELEQVWKGGPWTFDNQVLMLRRWQSGMTAKNVQFEAVSLWVPVWGAPFDMGCPTVAEEVRNRLGVVEEVERRRRHCASYFSLTKNGKDAPLQYGEWLKANGSRLGQGQGRSSRRATAVGDGGEKLDGDGAEAADSYNQANPKVQEGNGNGQGGKSGNSHDDGVNDTEISVQVETGVDGLEQSCERNSNWEGSMSLSGSKEDSTLHGKRQVMHGGLEHVEGVSDGPKDIKTRPKWTRLARMTDGRDSSCIIESNVLLGKRKAQQRDENRGEETEERTSKREKMQVDGLESKTAGVHEHPCRAQ
uniref:DUF4283 domain-containing protein n=1 Tax=Quercus lobata TaxID=97700 RepID=A0A7N2L4A2_QUELO